MKNILYILIFFPFAANSQIINTFSGNGTAGYIGDGGPATSASMSDPNGLVFDAAGNLYESEFYNHVIRKITPSGTITTIAGIGTSGYSGDGGPATAARLNNPINLAIDGTGNLYIADFNNNVVRKISTTGFISTFAGTGLPGYSGDGGPATVAKLFKPSGLAIDATGNVFISDCSNNRVRKVATSSTITTYAGTGGSGSSGDGGQATSAQVFQPFGVTLDATGNLYIAESPSNKVRKVAPGGIITTFAGTGSVGFSGDGGPAISAQINNPTGVALDSAGNIYIDDQSNSRIRKVSPLGVITTIAGNGIVGYAGDGGPAIAAEMNDNTTLAFDASWRLYFTDNLNNRIRIISNCVNAITSQPKHDTVIAGASAIYTVSTSLPSPVYQWQEDPGTGFVDLANVWPYSGVTTNTLTIHNASIYLNTTHYRCVVSNGSFCPDTSSSAILMILGDVGIKQLSAETINIFPDPTDDNIIIQLPVGYSEGSVQLINGTGQILAEQQVNNTVTSLDLRKLPAGMYIIKLQFDGQVVYKRVFKN